MLFECLVKPLLRQHKKIVAAWLIIFVISIPGALVLPNYISYRETVFEDERSESALAARLVCEQFPERAVNSSALIVIQAENVSSAKCRDLSLEIERRVATEIAEQKLVNVAGFTSVYSVCRTVATELTTTIGQKLYDIEALVNNTAYLLYGLPEKYVLLWQQVYNLTLLTYGLPAIHIAVWENSTAPMIQQRDAEAFNFSLYVLQTMLTTINDSYLRALAQGYFFNFSFHWNSSASNAASLTPRQRGLNAIEYAISMFVSKLSDIKVKDLWLGIWTNFTLVPWQFGNLSEILAPWNHTVIPGINIFTNRTLWTATYSAVSSDPVALMLFTDSYSRFYTLWCKSFSNHSLNGTPVQMRLQHTIALFVPAYVNSVLASTKYPAELKILVTATAQNFSLSGWNNRSRIHSYAIMRIGIAFGDVDADMLERIYKLGPEFNSTAVSNFINELLLNGTIDTYPFELGRKFKSNFISASNKVMLIFLPFTTAPGFMAKNDDGSIISNVHELRAILRELSMQPEYGAGIRTYVTGDAALLPDLSDNINSDLTRIEPVTVFLVIMLIGLFFCSLTVVVLPLATIGMAIIIARSCILLAAIFVLALHYSTLTFLFTVLMGVGIDYTIFMLSRYREELFANRSNELAIRNMLVWGGRAIVTSGATVIISFVALVIASSALARSLGLAVSIGITIALLAALTFVPAMLVLTGPRIFTVTSRRWARYKNRLIRRKSAYFRNAARYAIRYAKLIVLLTVIVSVPAIYMFFTAETTSDVTQRLPPNESSEGLQIIYDEFGAGRIISTEIVVRFSRPIVQNDSFNMTLMDKIEILSARLNRSENIAYIESATRPGGMEIDYRNLTHLPPLEQAYLRAAILNTIGRDNRTVIIVVRLKMPPYSPQSLSTVQPLRELTARYQAENQEVSELYVGGGTARESDEKTKIDNDFVTIRIAVLIGIFVVLMLILKSGLLPLFAIISIWLSIIWTFVVTFFLFHTLLGIEIFWLVPLILFVVLMGIGMDYNVFILTRITEEARKKELKRAIIDAVDRTGGIITGLALIMAGAFGSMLLSSVTTMQQFGFALMFAVLIDAMYVRTFLMPATIALLGRWAWWPAKKITCK